MPKCSACKLNKDLRDFHKNSKRFNGMQSSCIECEKKRSRESRNINRKDRIGRLRGQFIDKHGGKCRKCGFSDERALQIDHVNGGGKQEIKSFKNAVYQYYKAVLADTTGKYQLLCANCNWIKRYE